MGGVKVEGGQVGLHSVSGLHLLVVQLPAGRGESGFSHISPVKYMLNVTTTNRALKGAVAGDQPTPAQLCPGLASLAPLMRLPQAVCLTKHIPLHNMTSAWIIVGWPTSALVKATQQSCLTYYHIFMTSSSAGMSLSPTIW